MADSSPVEGPYSAPGQQRSAALIGMHIFLATEIMLFGGLFAVSAVIRFLHPEIYTAMSSRMHVLIGTLNTGILLTGSLCAALAVAAARAGKARWTALALTGAAGFGLLFLGLKAYEYWSEFEDGLLPLKGSGAALKAPAEHLFMNLYLVSTGLHAVHLTLGILLLLVFSALLISGRIPVPQRAVRVENVALYWHFVDLVWVFLYPVLYLAR